jgi:hypothetical protein
MSTLKKTINPFVQRKKSKIKFDNFEKSDLKEDPFLKKCRIFDKSSRDSRAGCTALRELGFGMVGGRDQWRAQTK